MVIVHNLFVKMFLSSLAFMLVLNNIYVRGQEITGGMMQEQIGYRQLGDGGQVFKDKLLWATSTCKSKLCCAASCVKDPQCLCFTVSPANSTNMELYGKRVECRGHWEKPSEGQPRSMSRMYELQRNANQLTTQPEPETTTVSPWLHMSCVSNADCTAPAANAECWSGQCTCAPGFYYSLSLQTCEASCSSLADDFLTYTGYYIKDNHIAGYPKTGWSLANCKAGCLAAGSSCVSLDYNAYTAFCAPNSGAKNDVPASMWRSDITTVSYYQRMCQ